MKHSGFTMIELLVAMALVAIGAALAAPSFRDVVMENRLASHSNTLVKAIGVARNKAREQHSTVELVPVTAGDWSSGWQVRSAAVPARVFAVFEPLPDTLVLKPTAARDRIAFLPSGRLSPIRETRFWLCDVREEGRLIIVQPGGSVHIPERSSDEQDNSGCS